MKSHPSRLVLDGFLGAWLCIGALAGCDARSLTSPSRSSTDSRPNAVETTVVRVVDGDTVAVEPVGGMLASGGVKAEEHIIRILGDRRS